MTVIVTRQSIYTWSYLHRQTCSRSVPGKWDVSAPYEMFFFFKILLCNFDNLSHNICLPRRLGDLGSAWRYTPLPVSVTRYLCISLSFSKKKQTLRQTVCICFFQNRISRIFTSLTVTLYQGWLNIGELSLMSVIVQRTFRRYSLLFCWKK